MGEKTTCYAQSLAGGRVQKVWLQRKWDGSCLAAAHNGSNAFSRLPWSTPCYIVTYVHRVFEALKPVLSASRLKGGFL